MPNKKLKWNRESLIPIISIIFILGFLIIQNQHILLGASPITTRATQQSVSLSVAITGSAEEELTIPATGIVESTDSMIQETISQITGLTNHIRDNIKIRVYTNDSTPTGFTAPATTQIVTVIKYVNITLNDTLAGTATIFFNVSQSDLGSIDTDDIKLYRYSTSWNELTTTVVDATADPAEFSATTTSFSNFLIGEKAEDAGLPTITPLSGPISKGGIKIEKIENISKPEKLPIIKSPELIKKVLAPLINLLLQIWMIIILVLAYLIIFKYNKQFTKIYLKYIKEIKLKKLINKLSSYYSVVLALVFIYFMSSSKITSITGNVIKSAPINPNSLIIILLYIISMYIYLKKKDKI